MNFVKTFSKRFFNSIESTKYLGRWRLENEHKTYLKADYANDDHCGVCSYYEKNIVDSYESYNDNNDYYSLFLIESTPDDPLLKKK
jgi:hypothetical protein